MAKPKPNAKQPEAEGLPKRSIRVPPYSYQASKAEMEEDMSVDAMPEALAACLGRTVAVVDEGN